MGGVSEREERGKTTRRGFGPPEVKRRVAPDAAPAPDLRQVPEGEYLDLEYVHEAGPAALLAASWRAVEVWTAHRVYALDASLRCVDVLDRASGHTQPDHAAIGASLVGGQVRGPSGAIEQVSHPFPRRGATAVFTRPMGQRLSYSETSPVTRVVLRLRVVDVSAGAKPPSWEVVTGPPGKGSA